MVRNAVERDGARVVLIDSLTGYHNAMPASKYRNSTTVSLR
jgi:circadian clock protein KaiC